MLSNMAIQITFSQKKPGDSFLTSDPIIAFGYSLEPPYWGGFLRVPKIHDSIKNKTIIKYPC